MAGAGGSFGRFVVDIDIGGTFTDAIIFDKNWAKLFKVDTTPHELSQCLQDVLGRAVTSLGLPDISTFLRHTQVIRVSTSLSTNTLMERKGSHCGLVVTKGWRSPYLSQPLAVGASFPLVPGDMVVEIDADIDEDQRHPALSPEDEVREQVRRLVNRGAKIIVVSLEGAETRPTRENEIKALIGGYYPRHFIGSVPVLLGSQISKDKDFLKRTNTAVINAYCHKAIAARFYQIEEFLRSQGYPRPVLVVHSSGGSARVAKTKAINTLNSGAGAGIFGMARLAKSYALNKIISVDMGGTTTEIGVLRSGDIAYSASAPLDGLPVDHARPVAATLAIGGGSIASINRDGEITIGPESVGAFPGPACYDLGGTWATVTDAYLILGYLNESYFLGGEKRLNKGIAERVFYENIAKPLGVSCAEAAMAVNRKVVEIIGKAILQEITRAFESRSDFSIAAIGGAGGCMGADLARFLGIRETHIFRQGAVFGAYGSSGMDIVHVYESRVGLQNFGARAHRDTICLDLNSTAASLQRMACNDMRGEGFSAEEIRFELELELNAPTLSAPARLILPNPFIWPDRDWPIIMELAASRFDDDVGMEWHDFEVSRVFLRAIAEIPHTDIVLHRATISLEHASKGRRPIYAASGRWLEADAYEWDLLSVPCVLGGPSVIESQDTTILVPPGMSIEIDSNYNGVIREREIQE